MPKVTEAHKAARRDEILDAAQRVFARTGYRGSSMTEIIKESGLSAGAIYSYFEGKDTIFRAVVERVLDEKAQEIKPDHLAVPRSPSQLMSDVLRGMIGRPIMTMGPQIWAEASVEPEMRAVLAQVFARLGGLLQVELSAWAAANSTKIQGDAAIWAADIAPLLVAMVPGFILQHLTTPDFDDEKFLASFSQLLIA